MDHLGCTKYIKYFSLQDTWWVYPYTGSSMPRGSIFYSHFTLEGWWNELRHISNEDSKKLTMTITPAFFICMLLSGLYKSWLLRKKMHVYTSGLSNILMVYTYLFESKQLLPKEKNSLNYSTCIECICYFQIFYQVFYLKVTDKSRSGYPQITYLLQQWCVQDFVTILRH